MTRSISTGISPVGIFLNHTLGVAFLLFLLEDTVDRLVSWAFISVEFWPLIVLFAHLEFDWYGWIPVGVTRRRSTHSERASARVDATFSTRAKLLVSAPCSTAAAAIDGCHNQFFVIATIAIQFLPVKAHIITANALEADDYFGKISTDSYITQVLHNLVNGAMGGSWLTAALSQVRFAPDGTWLMLIDMRPDSPEPSSPDVRRPARFCCCPRLCIFGSHRAPDALSWLVRAGSANGSLYMLGRHLACNTGDACLAGRQLASSSAGRAGRGMRRAPLCGDFVCDNK
jgi:hypothetical protein